MLLATDIIECAPMGIGLMLSNDYKIFLKRQSEFYKFPECFGLVTHNHIYENYFHSAHSHRYSLLFSASLAGCMIGQFVYECVAPMTFIPGGRRSMLARDLEALRYAADFKTYYGSLQALTVWFLFSVCPSCSVGQFLTRLRLTLGKV
ncbi:hypothetical protein ACTXT7_001854 [Hymenolepis weldensis]